MLMRQQSIASLEPGCRRAETESDGCDLGLFSLRSKGLNSPSKPPSLLVALILCLVVREGSVIKCNNGPNGWEVE